MATTAEIENMGLDVYGCPACKSRLKYTENILYCDACSATYPLLGTILSLRIGTTKES